MKGGVLFLWTAVACLHDALLLSCLVQVEAVWFKFDGQSNNGAEFAFHGGGPAENLVQVGGGPGGDGPHRSIGARGVPLKAIWKKQAARPIRAAYSRRVGQGAGPSVRLSARPAARARAHLAAEATHVAPRLVHVQDPVRLLALSDDLCGAARGWAWSGAACVRGVRTSASSSSLSSASRWSAAAVSLIAHAARGSFADCGTFPMFV